MVTTTANDRNNNTENTSTYPIMVELIGRMAGGSQSQGPRVGDGQVLIARNNP